jgi:hypothetical protein
VIDPVADVSPDRAGVGAEFFNQQSFDLVYGALISGHAIKRSLNAIYENRKIFIFYGHHCRKICNIAIGHTIAINNLNDRFYENQLI